MTNKTLSTTEKAVSFIGAIALAAFLIQFGDAASTSSAAVEQTVGAYSHTPS